MTRNVACSLSRGRWSPVAAPLLVDLPKLGTSFLYPQFLGCGNSEGRRQFLALLQEHSTTIWSGLRARVIGRALTFAFLGALLSACATVRLISDYDEPTDKALTAIQQTSDDFITKLIADAPSEKNAFEKHKQFYDDADQQLRRLEFRVASIPKNSQTVRLVGNIRTSLLGEGNCSADGTSLKDIHCNPDGRAKGPSKKSLQIAQRNLNQTIHAALALELAKRQGLEQNK